MLVEIHTRYIFQIPRAGFSRYMAPVKALRTMFLHTGRTVTILILGKQQIKIFFVISIASALVCRPDAKEKLRS